MGKIKRVVMSLTMDDMGPPVIDIKAEPTTAQEAFHRWADYFTAVNISRSGRKIVVND